MPSPHLGGSSRPAFWAGIVPEAGTVRPIGGRYGPGVKVYTKAGDDGTTGLFYGGRVAKDSELPTAYGSVDEAQAVIGLARAARRRASSTPCSSPCSRDLWVLMAELATAPDNRHKLEPGATAVTEAMVERLEAEIDTLDERFDPPTEFVVPGGNVTAAWLDLARTVVRRAERHALAAAPPPSQVVPYLNRLSDLLWTMARWQDAVDGSTLRVRDVGRPDLTPMLLTGTAAAFDPAPSIGRANDVVVSVARGAPSSADALGVPVATKGPVPRQLSLLGLDRATLAGSGFDAKVGQTIVVPRRTGPTLVAVGIGDADAVTPAVLRDAAAAFARAAAKHGALATAHRRGRRRHRDRRRRPGRRRGDRARPLPLRRAEAGGAGGRAT